MIVYGSAVRPAERSTQLEPRGTYDRPLVRLRGEESGNFPGQPCSNPLMSPFYRVKMHVQKSRRGTKIYTSDSISRPSIDPCLPFHAKRTDKAPNN